MKRITLGDARNSRIPKLLDLCSDDDRVRDYVNQAQRILLDCGKWTGTTQRIRLCVTNACTTGCNTARCITLPREVDAIEGVTVDGYPIVLRNNFFEFLPYGQGQATGQCDGWQSCDGFQRDSTPTFNDIIPPQKGLLVHLTDIADVGKTITFYGLDDNGVTIVGGVTVTLANPYATSTVAMSAITDVQKDVTVDRVLVYELNMAPADPGNWTSRLIAVYQPGETRPSYQRYYLPPGCGCRGGCSTSTILAMVKLGYVEAVADADYLVIGNLDALELMVQGLRANETGNLTAYHAFMSSAIQQLNRELKTETSGRQSIDFPVFGKAKFSRVMRGML